MTHIFLIVNAGAGVGHDKSLLSRLNFILNTHTGGTAQMIRVEGHAAIKNKVIEILGKVNGSCCIIIGGGGGSVRAAVEGIIAASGDKIPQRVILSALRMGSGNVLAKHYGIPKNPADALPRILLNLKEERISKCCVIKVTAQTGKKTKKVYYAVTMGGFGVLGQIPSDLAEFHQNHPKIHQILAGIFGVEHLTMLEYGADFFFITLGQIMNPAQGCSMRISKNSKTISPHFELHSGALLNFDVSKLPLRPPHTAAAPEISLYLIPRLGLKTPLLFLSKQFLQKNTRYISLRKSGRKSDTALLELTGDKTASPKRARFFLDEDPLSFYSRLKIEIAGTISFIGA